MPRNLTLLSLSSFLIPFSSPHAAMNSSNTLIFQTAGTERARITTTGISTTGSVNASTFIGDGSNLPATSIPTGAIMAFDLATCPTGWSEYTPARSRFLRGIDSTGTNDTTRTAGNLQADAFQGHWHNLGNSSTGNASTARGTVTGSGSYKAVLDNGSTGIDVNTAITPITDGTNGTPRIAPETRPKNVAVLYCRKN